MLRTPASFLSVTLQRSKQLLEVELQLAGLLAAGPGMELAAWGGLVQEPQGGSYDRHGVGPQRRQNPSLTAMLAKSEAAAVGGEIVSAAYWGSRQHLPTNPSHVQGAIYV